MHHRSSVGRALAATVLILGAPALADGGKYALIEVISIDSDIPDAAAEKLKAAMAKELDDASMLVPAAEVQRFRRGGGRQPELSAAEAKLQAGKQQMLNFEFKEALKTFREARKLIEPSMMQLRDYQLLVDVLLQTGLAASSAKDKKAAQAAYADLARIRPDVRIDPRQYPPEVIADFDKVRLAQSNVARGRLTLVSEPAGAKVFVDELELGQTPVTLALFPGQHVLRVSAPGYVDRIERIKVVEYQKEDKEVALEANEGLRALAVLESAVRKGAPPGQLTAEAATVASAMGAKGVIVAVVASTPEHAVISAARINANNSAVAVVVPFDPKAPDARAIVRALMSTSPVEAQPEQPIASSVAAEGGTRRILDFKRHLLGIAPGPFTEVPPDARPDIRYVERDTGEEKSSSWLLWVGAGVVAAAAGGGAYWYMNQPPPPPTFVIERR